MSVTDEITRLQTAKADLKTAIEGKGVTVPSNVKIDGYAELISSISGGAGGSCLGSIDVTGLGDTITLYNVLFRESVSSSWVPLNEGTDYNINDTIITFSRNIVGRLWMTFINYDLEAEFEIVLTITDTGGGGGTMYTYICLGGMMDSLSASEASHLEGAQMWWTLTRKWGSIDDMPDPNSQYYYRFTGGYLDNSNNHTIHGMCVGDENDTKIFDFHG